MNRRAAELARRQQLLLERSAALRGQFARDAQAWQRPLMLADRVQAGWRWLRANPAVPLGAAAALVLLPALLRPRRAARWAWRLAWRLAWRSWAGWRLWQRLRPQLQAQGWLRP